MNKTTAMNAQQLRQCAEKKLTREATATNTADDKKLLHELQVHQIELEMMNEDLRHAQIELEKSWARYADLYDSAPVAYLRINEQGLIREANLAACKLLGISRSVLLKSDFNRFIRPEDQERYYSFFQQLKEGTKPQVTELCMRMYGNTEFWARLEANQAKAADDISSFRIVISDITQSKQAEQALQEAKQLAEETARLKSEFLATMSHEIRTPINAIIGISELVLNCEVSPQVREYLERIRIAMSSLLAILNDILDFSKIESGCMPIETVPFCLDAMLDDLRALYSLRAQEKHIALGIEANPNVPRELIGDARSLRQVLSNLLSNAVKFTEQGEISLKIKLKQIETSQVMLEFSVEDSGIGICQDELGKLFDPFSQIDGSITRRFGGTGLGLTISHRLLQLMGSQFDVDSALGQGSRFSFTLSLGIADHSEALASQQKQLDGQGALSGKLTHAAESLYGARILVVEDNEINQILVKDVLELSGLSVEVVDNGREALSLLENAAFDAVLLDIHMPEMSGTEVAMRLRQQQRFTKLPIIAISAGVTPQERENCLASGINDFISKPFLPETLVATLAKWIKSHEYEYFHPCLKQQNL